jgi:D-threo-aldose 1-dehydrogenase
MQRDPLPTRTLGRTGLQLSEIGFGAGPLGGFYGEVAPAIAAATVEAAWDGGIRYFDTAPLYGYGRSELRLGHVLSELPRDSYVLSTKVGRYFVPLRRGEDASGLRPGGLRFRPVLDYGYDGAMRSLEQSLLRLGIERADIVLLHDLDAHAHGTDEAAARHLRDAERGACRALEELRASGEVRAIGAGVNQVDWALRLIDALDLDCILIAGRYTLLNQEALAGLLPLCRERGIGVLAAGPFNGGLLARGTGSGARYNYREAPPEILDRLAEIESVCRRWEASVHAAALQFARAHPAVTSVVAGAMSPDEIEANLSDLGAALPAGFWDELRSRGLLPPDTPVPAAGV